MKQVTLNFREVAADGLPEKSMDCAVIHQYNEKHPNMLPYSHKYKFFNARDYAANKKSAGRSAIKNITHWMPLDEFNAAFEDGETP